MAILNSQSNNISEDSTNSAPAQGQEQDMARTSQAGSRTGGPGEALNSGSSFLGDANGFLNQLNQLLQNPIVQRKIDANMNQQGQQVMGGQGQQGQAQDMPQERPGQNVKKKETPGQQVRPEDIDVIEVFQAKLYDNEQRHELIQGLEQIGALVDTELNGMDTSLQELKEYLDSEEFEKEIEQIKEAGLV